MNIWWVYCEPLITGGSPFDYLVKRDNIVLANHITETEGKHGRTFPFLGNKSVGVQ